MKSYTMEEALRELGVDVKNLSDEIVARAKEQIEFIALQTHSMIAEKAQTLKSTRAQYLRNLKVDKLYESTDQVIWSVSLRKEAGWIEEGYAPGSMIERILNGGKPARQAKDGSRYKIIPFKHNKKPSETSAAQQRIAAYAKSAIKKQGLDKIIRNEAGQPIIGRAASVKITAKNQPVGRFNQPLLAGLTIYQREQKSESGKTKIMRDVMAFRVMSSNQIGSGLWESKGFKGLNAFEEVSRKVDEMWNQAVRDLLK